MEPSSLLLWLWAQHLAREDVVSASEGPADLVAVNFLEKPDLLPVGESVPAAQHSVHEGQVGAVETGVRLGARLPRLGLVLVGQEICSEEDYIFQTVMQGDTSGWLKPPIDIDLRCKFRHPACALGSYYSSPPAAGTVRS